MFFLRVCIGVYHMRMSTYGMLFSYRCMHVQFTSPSSLCDEIRFVRVHGLWRKRERICISSLFPVILCKTKGVGSKKLQLFLENLFDSISLFLSLSLFLSFPLILFLSFRHFLSLSFSLFLSLSLSSFLFLSFSLFLSLSL